MAENFTELRVKRVRSDNAQEYVSQSFKNYCKSRDIMRDDTVPYTPQQNGVAKHMNLTIMETVLCMIHYAELPLSFWAEAVQSVPGSLFHGFWQSRHNRIVHSPHEIYFNVCRQDEEK